jgi:hypothetical protein
LTCPIFSWMDAARGGVAGGRVSHADARVEIPPSVDARAAASTGLDPPRSLPPAPLLAPSPVIQPSSGRVHPPAPILAPSPLVQPPPRPPLARRGDVAATREPEVDADPGRYVRFRPDTPSPGSSGASHYHGKDRHDPFPPSDDDVPVVQPDAAAAAAFLYSACYPKVAINIVYWGFHQFIPWWVLDTAACSAAISVPQIPSKKWVIQDTGSSPGRIDADRFEQWRKNLISLVEQHSRPGKGPVLAAKLTSFFSEITARLDFTANVNIYYRYAETRLRLWISSRDILGGPVVAFGTFNHSIYMQVVSLVQQEAVNELISRTDALAKASGSSRSSAPRPSRTYQGSSSSAQGSSSRFRNSTGVRCMVCGGDDHTSNGHKGTTSRANLTRKSNSWFWPGDKVALCWSFNGPNDCSRASACTYRHKCSLCGSEDHGAQKCSSTA